MSSRLEEQYANLPLSSVKDDVYDMIGGMIPDIDRRLHLQLPNRAYGYNIIKYLCRTFIISTTKNIEAQAPRLVHPQSLNA